MVVPDLVAQGDVPVRLGQAGPQRLKVVRRQVRDGPRLAEFLNDAGRRPQVVDSGLLCDFTRRQ
jgi:hypothetical protein